MKDTVQTIHFLLKEHYAIEDASVLQLHSEVDLNYQILLKNKQKYILKLANPNQKIEYLEFQNAVINTLAVHADGLEVSNLVPTINGNFITTIIFNGVEKKRTSLLEMLKGAAHFFAGVIRSVYCSVFHRQLWLVILGGG